MTTPTILVTGATGNVGRPVRFEELSPEQFRQSAAPHFPAPVVEDLLKALGRLRRADRLHDS
jgi:hypothetical protein